MIFGCSCNWLSHDDFRIQDFANLQHCCCCCFCCFCFWCNLVQNPRAFQMPCWQEDPSFGVLTHPTYAGVIRLFFLDRTPNRFDQCVVRLGEDHRTNIIKTCVQKRLDYVCKFVNYSIIQEWTNREDMFVQFKESTNIHFPTIITKSW